MKPRSPACIEQMARTYSTEAVPGVGVGQRDLDQGGVVVHPVRERGGDQLFTGREPAEQGGHANAGTAGHLVQRGIQAALGEQLAGGGQDELAIALGVRSERMIASHPAGWSGPGVGPVMDRAYPMKWNSRSVYV